MFPPAYRRLFVGAVLGLFAAACAEERTPINRVQPDALAKSFFVGKDLRGTADDPEFYKRGTVIDVGYGAAQDGLFTSTYAQPVSRIRWEITEERLNARLSYERISGTDDKGDALDGITPKPSNDGQIVASYVISSHFDIRRQYNPQTGEELNVIVENSEDRPWFEREYFRVDWSKNLVTEAYDYDTLSMMGLYGGIKYEPISYTILDPKHPDAPHFDDKSGYFDVTNKVYAAPQMVDLSGLGVGVDQFPACMLSPAFSGGSEPYGNCNPVEITIRDSYRRVTDTDYEPADHDGVRFQVLGAFNFNYRRGYERNYGMLDQHWTRFLSRYNLWERSHYYTDPEQLAGFVPCATKATTEDPTGDPATDPNRDLSPADGTADECAAAGPGSQCDVFKHRCTLPYAQRTARTIPWYVAGDMSLFEPVSWAVEEWDLALKTAVQTARLLECRKTAGTDCDARFPMWRGQQDDNDEAVRISGELYACRRRAGWTAPECDEAAKAAASAVAAERGNPSDPSTLALAEVAILPPVLVLCHNPVVAGDHPACGAPGLAPRLGDLRYNTVLSIPNPQVPSAWGIMTDGDDPLTGEKVAGSMNIWTHVTDLAAQQLVDLVRYANGELATGDITNGKYVRDFASAAKLSARGALPTLSKAEINQRLSAASELLPKDFAALTAKAPPEEVQAVLRTGMTRALDVQARNDVASPSLAKLQSVMSRARGTQLESELLNPALLQLAGVSGNSPVSGDALSLASPLALNNPLLRSRLRERKENALAARGACIVSEAPEPSSLAGLADILKNKFPASDSETAAQREERYKRMFHYVQRRYTYAVLAHEMGHSVGLRHNFVSSAASLFYRPQYWQLRTRNGQVTTPCTDVVADGANCVGPRYWDPPTDDEQSQLIWMWMQSTVMDYPGELTQDMLGLGATDFAAARFFYGDNVSVYSDAKYKAGTPVGIGIAQATDNFGGLFGIRYQLGTSSFHYSQLQRNFQVIKDCYTTSVQPPSSWNVEVDGEFDPVLDGHVVSVDGKPTKCRQQPVDYARYTDLKLPTAAQSDGQFRGSPNVEPGSGRLRVPYSFASDHWADLGNVSVLRHDNGADPYEQVQFLITTQETRHILDNYRRDRSTFSVLEASSRSFSRYNEKLQGMASGMGFLASIYNDLAVGQGYAFESLWPLVVNSSGRDNMIAATVAFDHFTRELGRPEPGDHYLRNAAFQDPVLRSASDADDYGPPDGSKPSVVVPNGATGYLRDVGFGGHPLENGLSSSHGDFDVEYIENAGSYYDKINTAILLAESEDRFVSQSRRDFYDARFRAVGMADVLGQGFRRVVANALTGDRSLLAPRVEAGSDGLPLLDTLADASRDPSAPLYPKRPLGWPSFWPSLGPEVCFSSGGRNACSNFSGGDFDPLSPARSVALDPQIGWEVQKFLIAWTVALIKANEKTAWLDMMRLYRLGKNANPEAESRVEWQDPASGEIYYARSFGSECLFGDVNNACLGGKVVEKGIAARVLEYANELTAKGYQLDEASYPAQGRYPAGFNEHGRAVVLHHPSGDPIVRADVAVKGIAPVGNNLVPIINCDQNVDPKCKPVTVNQNHFAYELKSYKSVPDYLWQAGVVYGLFDPPSPRGAY